MGSLFGQQIQPSPVSPIVGTGTQSKFLQALFNAATGFDNTSLTGVPGYPGPTSPDVSKTILPNVFSSWQPWNGGTQFMANYLYGGGNQLPQNIMAGYNNTLQYGGPGGYGTQLLHNQAQWGGTGGPGNQGMSYAMQYGAPSQAGQPIAQTSQYGTYGPAGAPLLALASGARNPSNPVFNALAPFLTAQPYRF